jgi:hypothetical protein
LQENNKTIETIIQEWNEHISKIESFTSSFQIQSTKGGCPICKEAIYGLISTSEAAQHIVQTYNEILTESKQQFTAKKHERIIRTATDLFNMHDSWINSTLKHINNISHAGHAQLLKCNAQLPPLCIARTTLEEIYKIDLETLN